MAVLLIESRVLKLERLMSLRDEFLSVEWESNIVDVHHSVLHLLLQLARRPVSSKLLPERPKQECREQNDDDELDLSNWGGEMALLQSGSELSEWSGDERHAQGSHLDASSGFLEDGFPDRLPGDSHISSDVEINESRPSWIVPSNLECSAVQPS